MTGNIDLDGLKWEPIGKANLQQIFKGVFDGGGYEIHNLRSEVISTGEAYSGLFGAIYQAQVTRVVLAEDCEIRRCCGLCSGVGNCFMRKSGFCFV